MKLRRTTNITEVWACLDGELFERIAEDGIEPEDFKLDIDSGYFFMIEIDGEDIGFWMLDHINNSCLGIHCNIMKPFRDHALAAGDLIVKWFYNAAPAKYQKLIAEIPVSYPEVYHYTKKFGFRDEGINRKSISKDGLLEDQYRLGLTREEASLWSLEV